MTLIEELENYINLYQDATKNNYPLNVAFKDIQEIIDKYKYADSPFSNLHPAEIPTKLHIYVYNGRKNIMK